MMGSSDVCSNCSEILDDFDSEDTSESVEIDDKDEWSWLRGNGRTLMDWENELFRCNDKACFSRTGGNERMDGVSYRPRHKGAWYNYFL